MPQSGDQSRFHDRRLSASAWPDHCQKTPISLLRGAVGQPVPIQCICQLLYQRFAAEEIGGVSFLESAGVLPPPMREIVLDRAMAVPAPITLDDLKLIVLMVYWRFGEEPDALVLDELCDDTLYRLAH